MDAPRISVVIPALDEAQSLPLLLSDLSVLGPLAEIIVSDGGSSDGTAERARVLGARVVASPRGRAAQLRHGAAQSAAPLLLFLHADCRISAETCRCIATLADADDGWGFFRPALEGRSRWLPVVSWCMTQRSRLSGIATGDQGLFLSRALYDAVGGFPDQPLMEDIEMCVRLRRLKPPRVLKAHITSSGRRWDRHGALRTIVLMWWLRLRYWFGADPERLHRAYYGS